MYPSCTFQPHRASQHSLPWSSWASSSPNLAVLPTGRAPEILPFNRLLWPRPSSFNSHSIGRILLPAAVVVSLGWKSVASQSSGVELEPRIIDWRCGSMQRERERGWAGHTCLVEFVRRFVKVSLVFEFFFNIWVCRSWRHLSPPQVCQFTEGEWLLECLVRSICAIFILCLSCCWKYFEGWLLQRNGAVGFVIVFASTCRVLLKKRSNFHSWESPSSTCLYSAGFEAFSM
jgi:hypothetical protein